MTADLTYRTAQQAAREFGGIELARQVLEIRRTSGSIHSFIWELRIGRIIPRGRSFSQLQFVNTTRRLAYAIGLPILVPLQAPVP